GPAASGGFGGGFSSSAGSFAATSSGFGGSSGFGTSSSSGGCSPMDREACLNAQGTWNDTLCSCGPPGTGFQATPLRAGGGLFGISPFPHEGVWAVGAGGPVLHFDGAGWRSVPSNTTEDLWSVSAAASNSVFAVGAHGTIIAYDGSTWNALRPLTDAT